GHATEKIDEGALVHIHNVSSNLESTKIYDPFVSSEHILKLKSENLYINGYRRKNNSVGIRNEIWIINTVGCINKIAENLAKVANQKFHHDNFHGFYNFSHPY